ncbi:unnamed protein product [Rhizophagus irregularis]|nr:unnamed protein product [Rhizophagus irregularis]
MVLEFCQINDDPNEPAVDDIEVDGNDSDEEDDTPQETYELRTDRMLLAEMMSNRQTRSLDDFSAHILAAVPSSSNSYMYPGLTKVCYDILKLKRQKASSSKQLVTQVGNNSASIDIRTLIVKQRLIRESVESHCISKITNQSIEPLRIIIMGTAGTVAPTGVAAFNIEGSIIHSSLSVPKCGVNVELEGEILKKL